MLNVEAYDDKEVYAHYDLDKFNIYAQTRSVMLEQLASVFKDPSIPIETVLDVGCGTGNGLRDLSKKFHFNHMYGLEPASEMLKIAHAKLPELIGICDSAENLSHHFPEPTVDLLNFHFIFAYMDYKNLIQQAAKTVKKNGILSICTNSTQSFLYAQELCKKYWGKLPQFMFNTDIDALREKYSGFMPKNTNMLIAELEKNDFEVLAEKTIRTKISVGSANEAWHFLYKMGWFTQELKNSSINKIKVYGIFYCVKFLTILLKHQLLIEDELEIIVLTAKKK
jgi:ubiquinone/menaquinone biosynthesis C-methylase UbiE